MRSECRRVLRHFEGGPLTAREVAGRVRIRVDSARRMLGKLAAQGKLAIVAHIASPGGPHGQPQRVYDLPIYGRGDRVRIPDRIRCGSDGRPIVREVGMAARPAVFREYWGLLTWSES